MKQVHVFYSGNVQGIGFRYTVRRVAATLGVGGWVKNLFDSRVELVAEGDEATLQELLDEIRKVLGSYINNEDLSWSDEVEDLGSFEIRF